MEGEGHLKQREGQVQRHRGRSVAGVFEEWQGGQCGWTRTSKGKEQWEMRRER